MLNPSRKTAVPASSASGQGARRLRFWVTASCLPLLAACVAAPPSGQQAGPASSASTATVVAPKAVLAPLPQVSDLALQGRAEQGGVLRGQAPKSVASLRLGDTAIPIASDGRFLLAFDRDAATEGVLQVTMADGRVHPLTLAVTAGNWRIERINAPMRGAAKSSAEFQRRRPQELAQIVESRAQMIASDGWRQSFIWLVTGRFSGFFGSQRIYQGVAGSYHGGTDIAVPTGTAFVAPADGVVVLAAQSPFTLEGNLLIVSHGMGLTSAFLHCQRLDVAVGDVVKQGQKLGTVGATGRATGPHMHWGVVWQGKRLDPGHLVTNSG